MSRPFRSLGDSSRISHPTHVSRRGINCTRPFGRFAALYLWTCLINRIGSSSRTTSQVFSLFVVVDISLGVVA